MDYDQKADDLLRDAGGDGVRALERLVAAIRRSALAGRKHELNSVDGLAAPQGVDDPELVVGELRAEGGHCGRREQRFEGHSKS